ncbi:MAG: hypothetical protein ACKVOH_06160 [Chlamydiales bacterium]
MTLLPKQPLLTGVDISASSMKIATLKKQKKGWHIVHLKEIPCSESVNPLDTLPKEAIISSAVGARQVLVRPLQMQLKREKDILTALEFQVESLFPYPAENAVVQAQILAKQERGSSLSVCSVRMDHIQRHIDLLKKHSIDPEVVTSVYNALAAFSALLLDAQSRRLMVHIGEAEVACALVEGGKLLKALSFDLSLDFAAEIKKTVLSLGTKSADSILVLGSEDPSYLQAIKLATGETPHHPSIPSLHLSQERLVKFGLSIGIALAGAEPFSINFRQKNFSYSRPWKRIKKALLFFAAASFLLFVSLFSLSHLALSQQKRLIQREMAALLDTQGEKGEVGSLHKPIDYSLELRRLEQQVMSRPDVFPLLADVPKIQHLLVWLSSQTIGSSLNIDSFEYQMVKHPDFSSPKEKYLVRVELEVSAPNSMTANHLRELLAAPNPFVDHKSEVNWESLRGKYRASFFLKDKTRYP